MGGGSEERKEEERRRVASSAICSMPSQHTSIWRNLTQPFNLQPPSALGGEQGGEALTAEEEMWGTEAMKEEEEEGAGGGHDPWSN